MGDIIYNKLVRDKIPAIIVADNAQPVQRTLTDDTEYLQALLEKLIEESKELLESKGSLEERADIAEVLRAIDALLGYDSQVVEVARNDKAQKRGGFSSRVFLDKVITND